MSNTLKKVEEIIRDRLKLDAAKEITMESTITNDLGADSLDTVELIMELEKAYEISIPDEVAMKIQTVGDVVKFIDAEEAKKAAK